MRKLTKILFAFAFAISFFIYITEGMALIRGEESNLLLTFVPVFAVFAFMVFTGEIQEEWSEYTKPFRSKPKKRRVK